MIKNIKQPILDIWHHRRILLATAMSEIKKKYAGSALGLTWAFLYPLMFLVVYAVVYAFVLKIQYEGLSRIDYILIIFSGLIPFLGFSEAISTGTTCVVANSSLIKNTMFPIDLIPVRTVICAQLTHAAGIVILLLGLLLLGKWNFMLPAIFVVWILQIMMEIGIVWILSSVNVIMKDLQNVISIVIMMLMMTSPIAYSIDAIPPALKVLMPINPIFSFVVASQSILIKGEMPSVSVCLGIIFWGVVVFFAGNSFFSTMKKIFVDNV